MITDPTTFERLYPGCSRDELPWWPSRRPVYYRTVPVGELGTIRHGVGRIRDFVAPGVADLYGPNGGGKIRPMLIATRGKDTLACWSEVGQMWNVVCP
jgi:hypothetical protein